ncbi:MAG: hypothetical protein DLM54_02045 [Acidimicrobiales bacterium]|nr:MAG: hypothetical protein DLM54_02045 [Acidimicrobiales bacterium]
MRLSQPGGGRLRGSGAEFRRPVVIVQADSFNASRISTAVIVPLTSNQRGSGEGVGWGRQARRSGHVDDDLAGRRSLPTRLPPLEIASPTRVVLSWRGFFSVTPRPYNVFHDSW